MSSVRGRYLVATFMAIALLLSGVPDSHALILCVHTDGEAALETGNDRCCLEGSTADGESQHSSSIVEVDAGNCPGCTDVVLSAGSQQASRSKRGEPPTLMTGLLDTSLTTQRTWLLAAFCVAAAKAVSPPLALPLRI